MQQLFLCLFTFFFVNILHVKRDLKDEIAATRKEIGERLKELREGRKETLRDFVERTPSVEHSMLSRIENGAGAHMDSILEILIGGLGITFAEFCRYFVSEDPRRVREEAAARQLLEEVFRGGPQSRRDAIEKNFSPGQRINPGGAWAPGVRTPIYWREWRHVG